MRFERTLMGASPRQRLVHSSVWNGVSASVVTMGWAKLPQGTYVGDQVLCIMHGIREADRPKSSVHRDGPDYLKAPVSETKAWCIMHGIREVDGQGLVDIEMGQIT